MKVKLILFYLVFLSARSFSQVELKRVFEEAGPARSIVQSKDGTQQLIVGEKPIVKSDGFLNASVLSIKNESHIVVIKVTEKAKKEIEKLFTGTTDPIETAFIHKGVIYKRTSLMPGRISSIAVSGFQGMKEAEDFASMFKQNKPEKHE